MKKILSLLLVLMMCVSLVGCGGSDKENDNTDNKDEASTKEEKLDLEIVDSGFSMDDEYLCYGVNLYNPNKSYYIELPTYTVTAYSDDGKIITTEDQGLNCISPNENIYWCGKLDCKGQTPVKVEFKTKNDKDNYTKNKKNINSLLTIDNVSENKDDYETAYTGIVKNGNNKKIDSVAIILIFKKEGKIVGGEYSFAEDVDASGECPFEISTYNDIDYDSYDLYAYNWSF